jgi:hypothetical protein
MAPRSCSELGVAQHPFPLKAGLPEGPLLRDVVDIGGRF